MGKYKAVKFAGVAQWRRHLPSKQKHKQHGFESHHPLHIMISIQIHKTESSFNRFVEDLMHKRVGQGWPETVNFNYPRAHEAYTWTDGVESILSIFFLLENGDIQEVAISDRGL